VIPDFTNIWEQFSGRIRAYIAARTVDQSLVDDILQEVFLKIHLHMDEVKEESRLSGWIYAITNNAVADFYRRKRVAATSLPEEVPAEEESDGCAACEIAAGLEEMARALPPLYAKAIMLVDFQGLSFAAAATHLGISVSGAKSRVQRARRMIRDSLLRCCHFVFDRYGTIIDYYSACCCCKKEQAG
jgi:RNA polymerase sigma-70 factor (ECF subfamily)